MPSRSAHEDEFDWIACRSAWENTPGLSWRAASDAGGGMLSYSTVRNRARAQGWTRPDGLGGTESASGIASANRARTEAATLACKKRATTRIEELAGQLADEIEELILDMRKPVTVREAKLVSLGGDLGQEVEIVDVELPEPTPAMKKTLATAAAILVDKALLVTGGVTQRTETLGSQTREDLEAEARRLRDSVAERQGLRLVGSEGAQ